MQMLMSPLEDLLGVQIVLDGASEQRGGINTGNLLAIYEF
jgi:hypothetical protein